MKTKIRQLPTSRDTVIDGFISAEDVKTLYARWQPDWEVLRFAGDVHGITCNGIINTGFGKLKKVYGEEFATRIFEIANQHI